jgi:hypothetical protein
MNNHSIPKHEKHWGAKDFFEQSPIQATSRVTAGQSPVRETRNRSRREVSLTA